MLAVIRKLDPMVALLFAATLLAALAPATGGTGRIVQTAAKVGIFVLFYLNGIRLSRAEVLHGLQDGKFFLPLTLFCFGAMAVAGLGISLVAEQGLPPLITLGFLYLACLPSTVQSATAYTSLANGNVAYSVVAAAMLNILGVFLSAPLFAFLSGEQSISLGLDGLGIVFAILILPFVLGQLSQNRMSSWLGDNAPLISWLDRLVIALAVYTAFSSAVEQGLWSLLDPIEWIGILALVTVLLAFAFLAASALATALSLDLPRRISFTFAGAHKSVAMGAPLALVLFPSEQAGLILVPLLIYHLLQLMISAPIASRFADRS